MKACLWLFLLPLLAAAAGSLDPFTLVGFDAELSARNFFWMVPYFNIQHLEETINEKNVREKVLTADVVEDYVLRHDAFAALPPELQRRLAGDLNLAEKSRLLRKDPKPLLNAQGEAINGARKLILDGDKPRLQPEPAKPVLSAKPQLEKRPALILPEQMAPARSDWAILNERWNRLPLAEKQAAVKISLLSDVKIADVILGLPVKQKDKQELKEFLILNRDAPAWLWELDYSLDGSEGRRPIEFALSAPASNKEEAFAVMDNFFHASRTASIRAAPHTFAQNDSAFHLHIGLSSGASPASYEALEPVLLEYRRLLAVRMLAAGRHNDSIMLPEDRYHERYVVQTAYDRFHRDGVLNEGKGLVRLLKDRHVELREQTMSPAETYREFVGFLEKGAAETRKEVTTEITRLMAKDPSIAQRIASLNPALLVDFAESLPKGLLRSAMLAKTHDREAVQFLGDLLDRGATPEIYDTFLEMRAAGADQEMFDQPFIYHRFGNNPETRKHVLAHLAQHPEDMPIESYRQIMEWRGSTEDQRYQWLRESNSERTRLRILHSLVNDYPSYRDELGPNQARVMAAFEELYANGRPLDQGVVLAKNYFNNAKRPFFLADEAVNGLAAEALWSENFKVARDATNVLTKDPQIFPEEVRQGLGSVSNVMEYLSLPHADEFISDYAQAKPEIREKMRRSIAELVRVGGPMPSAKGKQIEAITKSENKLLSGIARELLPLFRGKKEKAHAVHGPSPGCEENFAKIRN